MPIISGYPMQKKEKIKAEISTDILEKIHAYCTWANINDLGFFIEEAAGFVFAKDRDWKQHTKAAKKRAESNRAAQEA